MSLTSRLFPTVFFLILHLHGVMPLEVYSIPLKSDEKSSLHWTVNYTKELLFFEVHVALPTTSWFAVGFSDYGEPQWADFCVFWVDWKKREHFQDIWTDGNGRIHLDESQDCRDFQHSWDHGTLKFFFSRKFETCDSEDYIIEDGTTHIVWAEGTGPLYKINGVSVTSSSEYGFERTQLLKAEHIKTFNSNDTWPIEVLADNVKVPAEETTYWCHIQKLPKKLEEKHHILQYEPVIQKGNKHLIHHMEVFHCEAAKNTIIPDYVGPCFSETRPVDTQVCKRVVSAWAMGAGPFYFPKEAGLPIGGPDYNPFIMLEVHYHNPNLQSGIIDSSGMRLYVSQTLRKYDAGIIELGLEYIDKMAIPPGQNAFPLSGFCTTECTAVGLPESGITVFGSQLHTHLTGIKVKTRHVRNGVELPELNKDNHYSTHFQEIRRLRRPVRVLPGDALITTCLYKTTDRSNVTLGGFSITDEMCVNYIHYFPKADLEVCKSSVSYENLFSYFDYLNEFENQNTNSKKPISENYHAIEWTPLRVKVLNDMYTYGTLSMQCNRSSGARFSGDWEDVRTTKVIKPLPPVKRCLSDNST